MTKPPLVLYNSLTRARAPFAPLTEGKVGIYSCGPTVYHDPHLGNMRAYVFTDTLRRTLEYFGYAVRHVINITDVGHLTSDADEGDDKMEAATRRTGQSAWDVAEHYTKVFVRDLRRLNIRTPHAMPRATDYVTQMIHFAQAIAPRHCYQLDSGLYFDCSTVPGYGQLATGHAEGQDAGEDAGPAAARIDAVPGKRHPADFAIWRVTPPGESRQMEWDSPWGRGAPGWHLECSVMGQDLLGFPFDIHTGGIDHREVHHPNEIAQNCAFACTQDFGGPAHRDGVGTGARWWMHNNFLVDRSGKMSKSKGDFATLQSLVDAGVHPLAYRLMCLSAHYRSELEFSPDLIRAQLTRLKRLAIGVAALRAEARAGESSVVHGDAVEAFLNRFAEAIADDLNLPQALPLLDEVLGARALPAASRLFLIETMDQVFGLELDSLNRRMLRVRPHDAEIDAAEVEAVLTKRVEARASRDFAGADAMRDALIAQGIEVMDGDEMAWDWLPKL